MSEQCRLTSHPQHRTPLGLLESKQEVISLRANWFHLTTKAQNDVFFKKSRDSDASQTNSVLCKRTLPSTAFAVMGSEGIEAMPTPAALAGRTLNS